MNRGLKKMATARSIERIERYINEFAGSTNYRVNPDTLEIFNRSKIHQPPSSWFVIPYRGGYLFGVKEEDSSE